MKERLLKPSNILAIVALSMPVADVASASQKYDLDQAHSYIGFAVRHMAVSNVRGEFKQYSGNLTVDEADLTESAIELRIDAASIDTDVERRDEHLRSADFLDVENHPEIVFRSTEIEKLAEGEYRASGDLTIRGVTRPVTLDLEVAGPINDPFGNLRLGVDGRVTINRKDFGVSWSQVLDNGGLVVADDVKISFSIEAFRKAG